MKLTDYEKKQVQDLIIKELKKGSRMGSTLEDLIDADMNISITNQTLRKVITEMIFENNRNIGSSVGRGYFFIKNQSDFDEAIHNLKSRIKGLARRMKKLKENTEAHNNEYIQLDLSGALENTDVEVEAL